MNLYMCSKCGKTLNNAAQPTNTTTCENKTFHSWQKIAEVGVTNFECSKCGLTLQCKALPSNQTTCTNKAFHSWRKL